MAKKYGLAHNKSKEMIDYHEDYITAYTKELLDTAISQKEIKDIPFAGYGTDYTVGGGCVSGIGMVSGVECVIFGNDPSLKAGAMTVYVGEKWRRAIEISRENKIPFIRKVHLNMEYTDYDL